MTNIIRPNFGGRSREDEPVAPTAEAEADAVEPLHVYGTAAGYLVALMADTRGPEGHVLKVVVGPAGQNLCEAVAVMPATEAGRVDADASAMAVLRALEIVEQGDAPASA